MPALRVAVGLVAALAGCGARTEVVVRVTTDQLAIPDDVDALRLRVTDRGEEVWSLPQTPFCLAGQAPPGCLTLPVVATLFPGPKQPRDAVEVEVIAYAGSTVAIDDAATFTFADGQRQLLDFVLYKSCLGKSCALEPSEPQSCVGGSCTSLTPQPLPGEPPLDGGLPGTGADGAVPDGSVADLSAVDLTPIDLPPPDLLPTATVVQATPVTMTTAPVASYTFTINNTKAGDLVVATFVVCAQGSTASGSLIADCGTVAAAGKSYPCKLFVKSQQGTGGTINESISFTSLYGVVGQLTEWSQNSSVDATGKSEKLAPASMLTVQTTGATIADDEGAVAAFCQIGGGAAAPALSPAFGTSLEGMGSIGPLVFATTTQFNLPAKQPASASASSTASGSWAATLVTIH